MSTALVRLLAEQSLANIETGSAASMVEPLAEAVKALADKVDELEAKPSATPDPGTYPDPGVWVGK